MQYSFLRYPSVTTMLLQRLDATQREISCYKDQVQHEKRFICQHKSYVMHIYFKSIQFLSFLLYSCHFSCGLGYIEAPNVLVCL